MDVLSVGQIVANKYLVLEFIGRGSFSQVYKAKDLTDDKVYAVKIFPGDLIDINVASHEFRVLSELAHPNLARVYRYESYQDDCCLVMEFIPGPDILTASQGLSIDDRCLMTAQLCDALEYIHSRRIVHLDIKPSNILTDGDRTVKLLDFGQASYDANPSSRRTGTPAYISPEVISGQASDGRSDLYSLGVLMFQLFAGRLPFEAPGAKALARKHLSQPPLPPSSFNHSIPKPLDSLILRLLNKDPSARPSSAGEVSEQLSLLAGSPTGRSGPASPSFLFNGKIVGRDKELSELRQALNNAVGGQGGCLFISGETGIGRTKLLTEFALQAQISECQVVWARCYEEQNSAYEIILQIIRQLLPLAQNCCPQALIEYGPLLAEICPALASLPETSHLTPAPLLPAGEKHLRRLDAISQFITRTLEASPSSAAALLLESIQWIDRESLEAVCYLARNISKSTVLLLGSFRSDDLPAGHQLPQAIESLIAENLAEQIFLRRLGPGEVAELLTHVLPGVQNYRPLLDRISAQTEGNPLLIEESVQYLLDQGLVIKRRGQWQPAFGDLKEIELPGSLTKAMESKLNSLTAGRLKLVQAMAVMERPMFLEEVSDLSGAEPQKAAFDLADLIKRGLLAAIQEPDGRQLYGLHHSAVAKIVYQSLPTETARALHHQAAEIMEREGRNSLQDLSSLARHWEMAGQAEKARDCHLLAGEALFEYSKGQATFHFEKALAQGPLGVAALERLQKLYYLSGEYSLAFNLAREISELRGPSPDLFYKLGRCQERLGNYDASMDYYRQGLAAVNQDPEATARLMGAMAVTCLSRGEYRTAERTCQEALKMLPAGSRGSVEAGLYNTLGQSYWHLAEWGQALSAHRQSLSIKEREGSLFGIAASYNNLGLVYYRMYDWDRSAECHQKSFAIREKIGDISGLARSYNNLALIYRHLYDWEKALDYHSKCLQTMERIGASFETAVSLINIGLIHKARGEWDQALWNYNRAIQLAVNIGARDVMQDAFIRKAEFYLSLGSLKDADLFCQKSLELARELGRLEVGRAVNLSGRIAHMRHQWTEAKEELSKAREIFAELDIKAGEAYILKNLADLHRELNQLAESSALADRALSLAQRVEEQQLAAEAMLLKGELLELKGLDGLKYLEWALEIAGRVNTAETTWPILSAIARYWTRQKKYRPALENYQRALQLIKQALGNISQPDLKTAYVLSPARRRLFKEIKSLKQEVMSVAG